MDTTSCFTADEIKTVTNMYMNFIRSTNKSSDLAFLLQKVIESFPDELINKVSWYINSQLQDVQNVLNKVKISRTETVNELLGKKEEELKKAELEELINEELEEQKISVNDMVEKVTGIQGCVMPSNESNVNRMNKNAIIQAILLLENEMITFVDDEARTLKYNSLNTVNKKQLMLYLVDLQNSEVNVLKNGAAVKKMYLV